MGKGKSEIIKHIKSIAAKSSKFKVGKTGQKIKDKLPKDHSNYQEIDGICWSADPARIEFREGQMIEQFKDWKNNDNDKGGSAGEMTKSTKYWLYVVYTLKPKKIVPDIKPAKKLIPKKK